LCSSPASVKPLYPENSYDPDCAAYSIPPDAAAGKYAEEEYENPPSSPSL
jgi:hypothetical protein